MPRRLPSRWRTECVREFRAAARQRFDDGLALAAAGRRAGAIYLWGYSAEMILKAAYFTLTGIAETTTLTMGGHINPAINRGRNVLGIVWLQQGQGHNVRAWAELMVAERAAMVGATYAPDIARAVQTCGPAALGCSGAKRSAIGRTLLMSMKQLRSAKQPNGSCPIRPSFEVRHAAQENRGSISPPGCKE